MQSRLRQRRPRYLAINTRSIRRTRIRRLHQPHKKSDKKKKKMKKVVYYETDSSAPSTSDAESTSSKRKEHKNYSEIPLRYHHIPKYVPLLSVPLDKPPYFDGEEYSMWTLVADALGQGWAHRDT
jgi:hypothetical protein